MNDKVKEFFEGAICFLVMLPFIVAGAILLCGYPYAVANFYAYIVMIFDCVVLQIIIHFENKSRKK